VSKKRFHRERVKERLLDIQELSGGPYRIGALNRHRQFALLHSAAKARVQGKLEVARGAVSMSKTARTEQWVDRLSPMALIERRKGKDLEDDELLRVVTSGALMAWALR
jgi:hypothetical protein